jgi:hypothetical protein
VWTARALAVAALALVTSSQAPRADGVAQGLPFNQSWTNTAAITVSDDWSGVAGVIGYRGDALTGATGVDPQAVLADGSATPVDVNANQANPSTFATGGVSEFEIVNPVVALQGSGTARAPHIVLHLSTVGFFNINVAYLVRDIDGSTDNAVQPVALQYRVGAAGAFTNIPAGFIADATTGPSLATLVTPVGVVLPAAADNQALVQIRVITTDAVGSDEWVGIDDIAVTGTTIPTATDPTAAGAATPSTVERGTQTLLTVAVTPGANPTSTGLVVSADLTSIGGSATQSLLDTGVPPDVAGDNVFSFVATVPLATSTGIKSLPISVVDDLNRTASTTITLTVTDPPPPPPVIVTLTLPYLQDWSTTSAIAMDDLWDGVPGVIGYRGDDLTTSTGTDPRTIVADGSGTPVDVIANLAAPNTTTTGGVAEFEIADPTVAMQGSGTADAPHLQFNIDTAGHTNVRVGYNLRDIDGSADNAVQQVALQYRVGSAGSFVNLPAGYVADASSGPGLATLVTPINVLLPIDADNRPLVQVRVITTNAVGSDEWVGIDDIRITSDQAPGNAVLAVPTDGTTAVAEGGPADTYNLSLSSPPSGGAVTVQAIAGAQVQVSADGLAYASTATVILTDTTPRPVFVVAVDDGVVEGTVQEVLSHAIVASTDPTYSNTLTPVPSITVTVTDNDVVATAIHAIQGSGAASPLAGVQVTTRGVVTALKNNGFFVQEPDASADADSSTSEGLFAFTGAAPAGLARGDAVQVSGLVAEFVPSADPFQPPLTELTGVTFAVLSTGNALPTPVEITAAMTMGPGTTAALESLEGMRVSLPSVTVVGPTLGGFSEVNATGSSNGLFYAVVTGVARPFREPGIDALDPLPPGAPGSVPRFDGNPERLRIDSDAQGGAALDVPSGTIVNGIVGPLDFGFRTYTVLPDAGTATVTGSLPGVLPVPAPAAHEVTIAGFNLQRFFDTVNDPAVDGDPVLTVQAFANRLNKASLSVRQVLRSPDVVGVVEVENLSTLQALADRINADAVGAGGANPGYTAHLIEGNDVGGIDVGFLVKASRVAALDVRQEGKTETFIDPTDGSVDTLNDRPPLVLTAQVARPTGGSFELVVIVNHLRSLNNVNEDPGAGPRVREKRRKQAEFLAGLVQGLQVANPGARVLTIGDFNAFQFNDGFVDSMGTILGAPTPVDQVVLASADLVTPDLTNLATALLPPSDQYSYVFDGNAQILDHALASAGLRPWVSRFAYARSNADFPETARNDSASPARLSDHDASVTYLAIGAPRLVGRIVATTPRVAGQMTVTLQVQNLGSGNARAVTIDQAIFRTLAGTGVVSLAQALPIGLGDIAAGGSSVVVLTLNVPASVTRFSVTESGSLVDAAGAASRFSIAQAIVP